MKNLFKRIVALFLSIFMLIGVSSCGDILGSMGSSSSVDSVENSSTAESLGDSSVDSSNECEHEWRLATTILAPTYEEIGVGEYVCVLCFATERQSIPKLEYEEDSVFEETSSEDEDSSSEDCDSSNNDEDSSSEGEGSSEQEKEAVAYDGNKVTVKFYHAMDSMLQDILDEAVEDFNKLYPNITISHSSMGDYSFLGYQIMRELSAGFAPSMAYCMPDHVSLYQKKGSVLALDKLIENDKTATRADGTTEIMGYTQAQLADFIPSFYNEGKIYGDGLTYTLPLMRSTEVMYYNKTEFEKNGWTVPTTWDEMEALFAKIKAAHPTDIPLGYDSEANWFITMTEQLGTPYTSATGDHFLFDTAENRAFVERFRGWYDKGYITTQETYGNYTSDIFTSQNMYMCIASSAGAMYQCPTPNTDGAYPFEVGVAMIPQANPEKPKVISQGPSLCLFEKENPQETAAAWLFAKFLTTYIPFQASVSMNNGYTPVIKSVQENEIYADFLANADGNAGLQATVVRQTLAQMDAYFIPPAFYGSSAARDRVGILLPNCLVSKTTGNQTVADLIKAEFKSAIAALEYDYS